MLETRDARWQGALGLAGVALVWLTMTIACVARAGPPDTEPPIGDEDERKRLSERMGERVSRGAVEETLETLAEPDSRAQLGLVLNSPEMRDAVHDLTASLVMGAVAGVREARVVGLTEVEVGESVRRGIDQHVTPAVGRMVQRVVAAALETSLTDEHIARVELLTERTTRAAVRGLAEGLAEDLGPALAVIIEQDLGPALARSVERDSLPALARGLDTPAMQAVVSDLTRSVAAEVVGGAGDAIDEGAVGTPSGLELFGDRVALGYAIAVFVALAFGTLLIVLTVVLFRNSRRLRRQSEAASQREAALLNLVDNLETEHPDLHADLRALLRSQLQA